MPDDDILAMIQKRIDDYNAQLTLAMLLAEYDYWDRKVKYLHGEIPVEEAL